MLQPDKIDILLTWPADGFRLFQSMIPIGLVSIGTVLQQAGYKVKIIDFNHYSDDFRRELMRLQPKIIGIGGTTPSRMGSFLTARIAKEILPNVPIIYGGVHASFTATETLDSIPQIDYIIKGEAEFTFLALCDALTGKADCAIETIPGLCRRTPGGILENKGQRIDDLSTIPIPDRGLIGDNYSLNMDFIGGNGDYIITSRGCHAACNFCAASRMFPGGVRTRPIDSVMHEVEYLLSRKNISGLKLFDSTFTANHEHVHNFCDKIRHFNIPWECEIRADSVDRDLLRLMKSCGCYYVNIGMETTHQHLLKQIAKGVSPDQLLNVLALCKNFDIRSKVFFTFGHMGQTISECLDDIRFIEQHRSKIDFFAVTVGMRLYPGTRLEKEARQKGIPGKNFSWCKSARSLRNLFILEPGDVPVLFQKQLGPQKLLFILLLLLFKKLVCTERFLKRMILENTAGLLRFVHLQFKYTNHGISRFSDKISGKGLIRAQLKSIDN